MFGNKKLMLDDDARKVCGGALRVPDEASVENQILEVFVKEETLSEDGLECPELVEVGTGYIKNSELLCAKEEVEKDIGSAQRADTREATLHSGSAFQSVLLETWRSKLEQKLGQPKHFLNPEIVFPSEIDDCTSDSCAEDQWFPCSFCSARFTNKTYLIIHTRLHTGETPFSCPFCPVKFSLKSSLNIHIRTHVGDAQFGCTFCSAKLGDRRSLTIHLRKHTGEKPYTCSFCSVNFAYRSSLVIHLRRHTGERPYKCSFCSSTFAQRSTMTIHIRRRHPGERMPYTCTYCSTKR